MGKTAGKTGSVNFLKEEDSWKGLTVSGEWIWLALTFALAFLPRLVIALNCFPLVYRGDEFSTISAAGLIYPLSWEESFLNTTGYYGGGFSVLFSLFFYIFRHPLTIYRACIVTLTVLQALGSLIAYVIVRKHLRVRSCFNSFLLSVAAGYIVTRRSDNVTNESVLYLLIWIIVLLLFESADADDRKVYRRVCSVLLAAAAAYSLSVHERMLILIPMLAFVWIMYRIAFRKSLFSLLFFVPVYVAGYFLARLMRSAILNMNFPDAASTVLNTSVATSGWKLLADPYYWKAYLYSVVGTLTTAGLITFGLLFVGIILFFCFVFKGVFRKEEPVTDRSVDQVGNKLYIGIVFLACGIIAISLYQSFNWLKNLSSAMERYSEGSLYSLKILTYIRYFGIFLAPLCLFSSFYLFSAERKKAVRIAFVSVLTGLVCNLLWIFLIRPVVTNCVAAYEVWGAFEAGTGSVNSGYLWGSIFLFAVLILLFLLVRFGKERVFLVILCAFVIWQYCERGVHFFEDSKSTRQSFTDTYDFLEEAGIVSMEPEYYTNKNYASTLQFLLYDSKVHPYLPDYDIGEGVVITKRASEFEESLNHGWQYLQTTDGIMPVFVKGSRLVEALKEDGYRLADCIPDQYELTGEDFIPDDETALISEREIALTAGEYELEVNEEGRDLSGYRILMYNEDNGRMIVNIPADPDEGETGKFAVPADLSTKVRIVSETEMPSAPEKVLIRKIASDPVIGTEYEERAGTLCDYLNKHQISSAVYLNNSQYIEPDLGYITENSNCTFRTMNEYEIVQGDISHVLCFADDEWLSLLDQYREIKSNSGYVLLEKREKPKSFYYDLEKDRCLRRMLTSGTYQLRFKISDEVREKYDLSPDKVTCVIRSAKQQFEIPVKIRKKTAVCTFSLSKKFTHWTYTLKSGDTVIEEKAKIRKTVSKCGYQVSTCTDQLNGFVDKNDYTGNVFIAIDSNGTSYDLIRKEMEEQVGDPDKLMFFIDREKEMGIPDEGLVAVSKKSTDIFAYTYAGYRIETVVDDYVFLHKGSRSFKGSAWKKYFHEGAVRSEYYRKENGSLGRIDLSAGAFLISLDGDPEEGGSLYSGTGWVRTFGADETDTFAKSRIVRLYTFGNENLKILSADGTDLTGQILELKKVPALEICTVTGGTYDADTRTITGEGSVNLRTPGIAVSQNEVYTVSILFKGSAQKAKLSSIDGGHSVKGLNVSTQKTEEIGNGMYRMELTVNPADDRRDDIMEFDAEFDGSYEILDLQIECEE